jgi:hypothetical protein
VPCSSCLGVLGGERVGWGWGMWRGGCPGGGWGASFQPPELRVRSGVRWRVTKFDGRVRWDSTHACVPPKLLVTRPCAGLCPAGACPTPAARAHCEANGVPYRTVETGRSCCGRRVKLVTQEVPRLLR